jgi:hypothetical protein
MKILSKSSGSAMQRYCLNWMNGNDGFSLPRKRIRPRVERCMVWWVSLCIVAGWAFEAFNGEP